jgi:hypothetical protein
MATVADANAELIVKFYTAFQNMKGEEMASYYSPSATFCDPAFGELKGQEVGSMWKMLTGRAKNFKLTYSNVKGTDHGGSADWVATYLFQGKRLIVNKIHSEFVIVDGRITEEKDTFDFYAWIKQALGIPGYLFGWSSPMQAKVQGNARRQLETYMAKHKVENENIT